MNFQPTALLLRVQVSANSVEIVFELARVESQVRYGCMRHSDLERRRHVPNLAGGFQWSESFDLNVVAPCRSQHQRGRQEVLPEFMESAGGRA
jgi:hypothetical protein